MTKGLGIILFIIVVAIVVVVFVSSIAVAVVILVGLLHGALIKEKFTQLNKFEAEWLRGIVHL